MISPYFLDLIDNNDRSNITYNEVLRGQSGSEGFMAALDAQIAKRRLRFSTKHAIAVTYNDIDVWDPDLRGLVNSFQVVFVSDGNVTYSIFNYDKTPELISGNFITNARAGYYEPGNVCANNVDLFSSQNVPSFRLPENTNTDVLGRYVFLMNQCGEYPIHINYIHITLVKAKKRNAFFILVQNLLFCDILLMETSSIVNG